MQKKFLWMLTVILFYGLVLTSCSNDDAVTPPPAEVEAMLKKMTLREKVGESQESGDYHENEEGQP